MEHHPCLLSILLVGIYHIAPENDGCLLYVHSFQAISSENAWRKLCRKPRTLQQTKSQSSVDVGCNCNAHFRVLVAVLVGKHELHADIFAFVV